MLGCGSAVVDLVVGLRNGFEDGGAKSRDHFGVGGEDAVASVEPSTSDAHIFLFL